MQPLDRGCYGGAQREAIVSGPEKKVLDLRPIFGLRATITTPAAAHRRRLLRD